MLTDAGEAAFDAYWPALNRRRATLQRKQRRDGLCQLESNELKQVLVACRAILTLFTPPLRDPAIEEAGRPWRAAKARQEIARRQAEWKATVAL